MTNKVGFGLVGFGSIGRTHLAAMQLNLALREGGVNAAPRALCTRRPDERSDLPFERIYGTLEETLADSDVRVLDICTPNNLHVKAAEAGLNAGKAVYVEKPLSHDEAGAEKLRSLAEQTGLPNQCALTMRFRPMINRMKDALEEGLIGEPVHFRVNHFHASYLAADKPMSWRQNLAESGGGAVMDLGIHILDLTRYFLGDVQRIRAISRILHKTRTNKEGERAANNTDEYLKADLETMNGVPGILECSRISKSCAEDSVFEIFGTAGTLLLHGAFFSKLSLYEAGRGQRLLSELRPGKRELEARPLLPESRQSAGAFLDGHAAAIKNMAAWAAGEKPFSGTPTFAEAEKAQALVHAALRSAARDGLWETL